MYGPFLDMICLDTLNGITRMNNNVHAVFTTQLRNIYAWLRLLENTACMRSVDVVASLDRLEWCKMHNTQFPTIAKACSNVPGYSSVISASGVFSRAISIQKRQRWSLHVIPQRLEASIMLKHMQCMDASKEISQCYCSMYMYYKK